MRTWVTLIAVAAAACSGDITSGGPGAGTGADAAAPIEFETCREGLDLYGVAYVDGPARQGVSDPITVTPPIGGIDYRPGSSDTPRTEFFMDCALAAALLRAAPFMVERDVVEVLDYGVYNYRCIGGGEPPDCPNGISEHAYATAIDIAGFTTGDGTFYSVNDDWVIDPDDEETCAAGTESAADAWLHEIICEMKAAGVWNIVLTPNYNDAHRNHFHVDLKDGSDFIRARLPVDEGGPAH